MKIRHHTLTGFAFAALAGLVGGWSVIEGQSGFGFIVALVGFAIYRIDQIYAGLILPPVAQPTVPRVPGQPLTPPPSASPSTPPSRPNR